MAVPPYPNLSLEQLRKRAKELRDFVRTGHPKGVRIARELHPRWIGVSKTSGEWAGFTLADAQLCVARSHGHPSWPRLVQHVEMLARYRRSPQRRPAEGDGGGPTLVDEFLRLACLTYCFSWDARAGEEPDDPRRQAQARRLLTENPDLAATTIHTAAAVGDVATARSMLAGDESLANQAGGPHGWPPLLYLTFSRLNSTEAGHSTLEVARLLLDHGADPNAGYLPDGQPPVVTALSGVFRGERDPVHQPAHQHSMALARLLLDAGAEPNDDQALRNTCGYPHDDDTGLALLLEYGLGRGSGGPWLARLEHDKGFANEVLTPKELVQIALRYSAQWNLPNRVRLLLRHCAEASIDINTTGTGAGPDPGHQAYKLAVACGNTEIADLLARAGATTALDPIHRFLAACQRADRPEVDRLLAADPSLLEQAASATVGPEPLHLAVALERPEAVAFLAELGFPIDKDWSGWGPPLHTAALTGNLGVVKLLVELGADPAAQAPHDPSDAFVPDDSTPAAWAAYFQHHEVAAYLTSLTRRSGVAQAPAVIVGAALDEQDDAVDERPDDAEAEEEH